MSRRKRTSFIVQDFSAFYGTVVFKKYANYDMILYNLPDNPAYDQTGYSYVQVEESKGGLTIDTHEYTFSNYDSPLDSDGQRSYYCTVGQLLCEKNSIKKIEYEYEKYGKPDKVIHYFNQYLPFKYSGNIYSYNYKGRMIQSLSNNHTGGYEKYYYGLSFTGSPARHRHVHKAFSNTELAENYTYEYDHAGRLTATNYTINNLPSLKMNSFEYDDLGRVKKKKFNNDTHTVSYTYNLHSQLKSVTSDYFTQTLRYQDGITQKKYNGSISEIDETTLSTNNKLYHTYQYDGVNPASNGTNRSEARR